MRLDPIRNHDFTPEELAADAPANPPECSNDGCTQPRDRNAIHCVWCVEDAWEQRAYRCDVAECDAKKAPRETYCGEHLTADRDGVTLCENPLCDDVTQPGASTCSTKCSARVMNAREHLNGADLRVSRREMAAVKDIAAALNGGDE